MLAEILHVCRHAPATLALKRKLPQDELYATLIERADRAGLADRRRALVAGLRGHVVEIGCGTGAMFSHYDDVKVTGIEPDADFAARARVAAHGRNIDVVIGSGETMPFADRSLDGAVIALVLCSVPDADAVCREIARVVKPGGAVRLIEHVRSDGRVAGALMRAVNPLWLRVNGQGCNLDRDPLPALDGAGIRVESIDAFQIWSAGLPAFPMRLIRASRV
jgi:SAM-dependent methyltransferase